MRIRISLATVFLLSLATAAAFAQDSAPLNTRSLAATCANCHGTQGHAVQGSAVPALAGMPREHMLAQLKAFKDGSRPATVMHQIAKGYSEQQLETLASYFANQSR